MSGMKKRPSCVNDKESGSSTVTNGAHRYVKRQSVSTYRSMVSDLGHRRAVHCVEHYPCLPDPQRVVGTTECGTVHYGFCVPVTIVDSPADDKSSVPALGTVDPVCLLSSPDLESDLKSLVNQFVARDKACQTKNVKSRPQSPNTATNRSNNVTFVNNCGHNGAGGKNVENALSQLILEMNGTERNGGRTPDDEPVNARKVKNGDMCFQSPVDYAKKRFQLSHNLEAENKLKAAAIKFPVNGIPHLVSETKSRFENGLFNQNDRWKSEWLPSQTMAGRNETLSPTLAKYKHLLHPDDVPVSSSGTSSPRNKSPDAGSPQLPHPKLTSIQKQHIRERALSPPTVSANTGGGDGSGQAVGGGGGSYPMKPFLTKGSVAERVLIFERCPVLERGANRTHHPQPLKPLFNTWKTNQNYATSNVQTSDLIAEERTQKNKLKENREPSKLTTGANVPLQQQQQPRTVISPVDNCNNVYSHRRQQQQRPLPPFHYPCGRPISSNEVESQLTRIAQVFSRFDKQQISREQFGVVVKACSLPLYVKVPLFTAAGGESKDYVSLQPFLDFWKRVLTTSYDLPSKFVNILTRSSRPYLLPDDFISLIQDVIESHPGLTFLKEAEEFHSRYVQTVIARIYYCANRSWSGRISIPELRKSNFLQVLSLLEEEDDINQITDYFSYEHFYVIYCNFWELDKDHDLLIDRNDLCRHNDGAISTRMINRLFSGAVTREKSIYGEEKLTYSEFVWFLLSEEDKRHPTSIEYWFRCMDLDGDGYLSMYELEYFYEEQLQRMDALGIEALPFQDCLCQMLDMILPKIPEKLSLSDLKRCRMTSVFFDTFFNLEKYLDHEQKDPFAFQRDQDGESGSYSSDWNRFAAQEYEMLVAEEGAADQDEILYDDEYEQEDDDIVARFGSVTIDGKGGLRVNNLLQKTANAYGNDVGYAESDDYQY